MSGSHWLKIHRQAVLIRISQTRQLPAEVALVWALFFASRLPMLISQGCYCHEATPRQYELHSREGYAWCHDDDDADDDGNDGDYDDKVKRQRRRNETKVKRKLNEGGTKANQKYHGSDPKIAK